MIKTIKSSSLAGGKGAKERVENDYYATDPKSTRLILNEVDLNGSILEPACGEGHISEVLGEYYPNSEIVSTDLIDRGYSVGGIDFLNHDFKRNFDNVITNPPFKLSKEFIERALGIANDKVIMFGKIQLLESSLRYELFRDTPLKYVYVHVNRQTIFRNGQELDENGKKWASTMCFAWFVWEKSYKGEPIIRFLK